MSADFWAGYISGAAGIIIGNPLDVVKVRLQAGAGAVPSSSSSPSSPARPAASSSSLATAPSSIHSTYIRPFLLGTAAPVLGYGALNALLFVSYNRTETFLNSLSDAGSGTPAFIVGGGSGGDGHGQGRGTNLATTWLAGAVGGLATWVVSAPTELVKCRAQLQLQVPIPTITSTTTNTTSTPSSILPGPLTTATTGGVTTARGGGSSSSSSWAIAKSVIRTEGIRGLYFGGTVTAIRDSVGYGFYFWGYELCSRWMRDLVPTGGGVMGTEAARVLLCGGLAGIITWASIFPLDVIKTKVQAQLLDRGAVLSGDGERAPLIGGDAKMGRRLGAWEVAKETYRKGGIRPFFRGLTVCSVRAFIVNAVQWAVYEWIMLELGQGRKRQDTVQLDFAR
ncbi:mitochondrial carrier domain-containing protein [Chaetomium strumarium]|uniref:Mitochondrial carrier domain-containing protein n=1 Tax=Chaetomium strumarium TaxID=1170767 RepID=A0AAJ0GSY3_9PEZI|nr:mitochondrial carrier domain-containing protein [Chaetomium strumarium]